MAPKIIYEDSQTIVLNKPAGLVTTPGPAHEDYNKTLAGWLLSYIGMSLKKVGLENRWGIVHRLDKDTSGLIVCAKVPEAFEYLTAQFKKREVKKKYSALCWGEVKNLKSQFKIDASIARNPKNRMKFCVADEGKEAVTEFRVLGMFRHSDPERSEEEESRSFEQNQRDPSVDFRRRQDDKLFTLLEARPHTGRTHQIRVHLKHIGYPIVGDYLYSGRKRWRFAKNVLGLQRQFLHASSLSFKLLDGTVAEFESELPKDLQTCLAQFTAL